MRLLYRVMRKEEVASISKVSSYKEAAIKDVPPVIENIQRPPTPPPSPKPSREQQEPQVSVEPPRALESTTSVDVRDKEIKSKKPRCEVTPVMRTLEPPSTTELSTSNRRQSLESAKSKDVARLEHRKRHKRRNKRVIAEITTTPREDLLKLKVRLTPCPPRITSGTAGSNSSGSGAIGANSHSKEKLLQMRAVRREKLKTIVKQRAAVANPLIREETKPNDYVGELEETIEDIIDSIPDEVVRIAQNINNQNEETSPKPKESVPAEKKTSEETAESTKTSESKVDEPERPKKDEEILRRLGLIAVNEASDRLAKQRAQSDADRADSLDRERLEKQLRESKANRVRSLLAEKQMRDALKTIMSTKEELASSVIKTPTSVLGSHSVSATVVAPAPVAAPVTPKKKEPPPLTPLRVAKPSGFAATSVIVSNITSKYETPLDLSSGGTAVSDKVLDLSATLPSGGGGQSTLPSSSSSSPVPSSSPPSSSSSSSSSSPSPMSSVPLLPSSKLPVPTSKPPLPSLKPPARPGAAGSFVRKSKEPEQPRVKGPQESNLRTLSDAAVSRLSGCLVEKNQPTVESPTLPSATTNATTSKVALRIPQPHHRLSGFGMKIKPNLGVRHIPNPQAVVVSQYRNQKLLQRSYFNVVQKPP